MSRMDHAKLLYILTSLPVSHAIGICLFIDYIINKLMRLASSQGFGETAQMHSLTRAFAACIHKVLILMKALTKGPLTPLGNCACWLKAGL